MSTNGLLVNNMVKTLGNKVLYNMQQSQQGMIRCTKWNMQYGTSAKSQGSHNYAVMVLNRPITQSQKFIMNFWNDATVRVTVDGGTVEWDKYISKMPDKMLESIKPPDLVTGDFDSITKDILEKYQDMGCKIVHTPDQNFTDFTKALDALSKYCAKRKTEIEHVVALGQSSGRPDHIFGNIQTLFLAVTKQLVDKETRVYLMSDDSISWLMNPGKHIINISEDCRKHKKAWCSLIPVGETCLSVTTTGLKWNLDNQRLKFGDLVSTSNTFDGSSTVTVVCSHTLLWSMRVPSVYKQ